MGAIEERIASVCVCVCVCCFRENRLSVVVVDDDDDLKGQPPRDGAHEAH